MRINFNRLFVVQNDMVSPKANVEINGVTMGPGVSFGGGVSFDNVDLTQFIGKDLEVDEINGVYHIRGVYQ